jgi:hypothetical protein
MGGSTGGSCLSLEREAAAPFGDACVLDANLGTALKLNQAIPAGWLAGRH